MPHASAPDAPTAQILPLGADGIVVRFASRLDDRANRAALALARAVEDWPEAVEVMPSLASTLVRFDPAATRRAALGERLRELIGSRDWSDPPLPAGRRLWHVPVLFGGEAGPQLAEAADLAGLSPEKAVAELTAAPLRVLAIGFAPGQPYLGLLPAHWDLPRQTALTPRVPAGAVTVAVRQVVAFAAGAPTGWRQVGRTAFPLFRPDADPPAPLRVGDELRFHAVPAAEFAPLWDAPQGGARAEPLP